MKEEEQKIIFLQKISIFPSASKQEMNNKKRQQNTHIS
jgi:hypothetical protein